MPCRSDYMEPTEGEKELSRVCALLDELRTGKQPSKTAWDGLGKGYNRFDQKLLDEKTAELCSKIQNVVDICLHSLEMQIWWRDHQKADRKRVEKELEAKKDKMCRKRALAKLTAYERRLLGVRDE